MILSFHLPWLQVTKAAQQQIEVILQNTSESSQRSVGYHRLVSVVAHGLVIGAHIAVNKCYLVRLRFMCRPRA